MSEKKVVVQVLADTKPFIRSLLRLRKIAESIDGSQIKNSNKLLKSVIQKQKMDDKIQKMAEKAAKAQQKASKESEESQERVLKKAIKYGAIVESIRRSYRAIKGGFTQGYDFGRGVVDPARTYGVDLTKATQANALYSAFGGKAGGGADVLGKFLQNRLDFLLYQRGPLKEAAGRFGLNQQALLSGELTDFVREIRRIREERGLSDIQTQGLLQAVGFGGDAAIMRMVTESPEDFEKSLKKSKNIAQSDEERLKAFEETEKSFETMMTNIKTTLMDWATYLKPVIDGFNKLGPTLQTLIASVVAASSALASLGALKSLFSAGAGAVSVGGAGAVAGAGAGAVAGMSTIAKLGVGTLYVGTAVLGGFIGRKYVAPFAAEAYKRVKEEKRGVIDNMLHPIDALGAVFAGASYGVGDLASYLAGHNDEETQNKLAELLRRRNRDNSSDSTERLSDILNNLNRDNSSVDISDLAGHLYNNNNEGARGRLPELSGIGTRNGTVVEAINVYVSPSGTSDPYTYGERTGGALENAISNMNFFTNGSSL